MRSAMCAASQLPGRGPTDVDDAPSPAVKQKSNYDMMMIYLETSIIFDSLKSVSGMFKLRL